MVTTDRNRRGSHLSYYVEERKVGKRRPLVALALILIALITLGYASYSMGAITVEVKELATISYGSLALGKLPKDSAGTKTVSNGLSLTYQDAAFASKDVTIKIELIVSDADMFRGFKSFVVLIKDGGTVKAILTMNNPYGEFTYTITTGTETKDYDIQIIYATGNTAITISGTDLQLGTTVVG